MPFQRQNVLKDVALKLSPISKKKRAQKPQTGERGISLALLSYIERKKICRMIPLREATIYLFYLF